MDKEEMLKRMNEARIKVSAPPMMTTIYVSVETRKRFRTFGHMGETEDQLLNWMMDHLPFEGRSVIGEE